MVKYILVILALILGLVGVSEAQVTQGTVFSKTLDGVGTKITSTVVGPDTGLDVNCIGGTCGGTNPIGIAVNDGACPSGGVNFTVAASNGTRTWLAIWASPANTDDVYIKLGVTATAADARIAPGQPINFTSGTIYTGQIDAFPNSGTQAVCLMELN